MTLQYGYGLQGGYDSDLQDIASKTKGGLASGTGRGRTRRFKAKLWVKLSRSALFCISRAWRCMDGIQASRPGDPMERELEHGEGSMEANP